ncbi:MAG: maleylpyruvate isomerase family mycothiol-dependent enzyme [Actinobacteria bacterium]|nr:maleylpyruvate isomerase family mycothiol-dependent enzyme [Actinomycetota bacterium]
MREILADLVAEQQGLDQLLQRAPERDWKKPTRAKGWTVQDTISHLAWSEDHALYALQGDRKQLKQLTTPDRLDGFNEEGVAAGRGKRPQEVIEWWRFSRAAVVDSLSRCMASDRIPWMVGDMSARTFATFRLMETWAHGLDIRAALDREDEDTPRLRHIAWLGWATLPHAFAQAGEDYDAPIRVEVTGPAYSRWVFGPADSDQVVKGPAGEWCRLVVKRLDAGDAEGMSATGEVAETALRVARTFP